MLLRLEIQNLAIIENVDVTFGEGFTCLTGGTGAGKSLVIDSLSLLLGERASTELIREGCDKAVIRGHFRFRSSRLRALLDTLEIPSLDNSLVIERVISKSKSTIKANGIAIALSDLSRLASYLADIHSQFDLVKLMNPENYLSIIDGFRFDQTASYKADYLSALSIYKEKKAEMESLLLDKKRLEENREFYEFQYKELKAMNLRDGEEEEIEEELATLKNFDKVYSLSKEAEQIIDSDFLDKYYELNKILAKLASFVPNIKENAEILDERYYEIDDLIKTTKKAFSRLDYDPERLNELEQRSFDLTSLKRKYKKDIPALIAYYHNLDDMLSEDHSIDEKITEKEKEVRKAFESTLEKGKALSALRRNIAKSIENEVEGNLSDLLLKARFSVAFLPNEETSDSCFYESGIDNVDFLIETNVGEGMRSLAKVVSGGEASRLMLAFKVIFIRANKIETVIFDEIDTGVSGEVAYAVSHKIAEIALSSQVLAITHLPQVASLSDHHILIEKSVKAGRTYTKIQELGLEGKIREVAHLISGGEITEKQLEYAREMVLSKRG